MSRSRNIKPGFFANEVIAELPCEVRLLFIGLWTLADREGRLEDRPKRIKMMLFAYDSFDVDPMLTRLRDDGFLTRYVLDGVSYIQVTNFVKHQDPHYKEKASVIPPPPGEENKILANGVTRTQRARIFERDGYKCCACGSEDSLCIDHVIPVSRGGTSDDENLQTLCSSCNTKKGNKLDGESSNSRRRRIDVIPPSPNHIDASPSDSLIPDSLIPDSLKEKLVLSPPAPRTTKEQIPFQEILDAFVEFLPALAKPQVLTSKRKTLISNAWKMLPEQRRKVSSFRAMFRECADDQFLNGNGPYVGNHENWRPTFDFILRPDQIVKVYEKALARRASNGVNGNAAH